MNWPVVTIVLREAFEALLIIGILSAVARKSQQTRAAWSIGAGVLAGLFASLLIGYMIIRLPDLVSDQVMLVLEVIFPAVAALMILQTLWWMQKHARGNAQALRKEAENRVTSGQFLNLAFLAFVAISREGTETVMFLSGELMQIDLLPQLLLSISVALSAATLFYFIISRSLPRIGFKWFFAMSSMALLVLSGKLLLETYHQMSSRGWL